MDEHYPEHLLKDYELLLRFFPSHTVCRPTLVNKIREWKHNHVAVECPYILEVGPGNGESTELILRDVACTMTLVEVDLSSAEKLQQKFPSDTVTVITADALAWIKKQKDESCDVVTASWVFHNFTRDERALFLPEIYRVLKPSGLLALFDKILPNDKDEVKHFWKLHEERLGGLDALGKTKLKEEMLEHEARDRSEDYIWYEHEAQKNFENSGFKNVQFHGRNECDVVVCADK